MKYRPLGDTGLRVSEIGFGTWGLGGDRGGAIAYGPASDEASRAALHAAFDVGINFFDTADLYGFGHSEELLGEVFSPRRESVVIATKGGFENNGRQDFSPDHLCRALDASLRRLRTSYVDLYQLHNPSMVTLREHPEIVELMGKLRTTGKIRAWGVSARSPEEAFEAIEEFTAPCVQVNFNLTDQRAITNGLFDLCQQRHIGVIARTPLCFGFLTGKYAMDSSFTATDHRRSWPARQLQRWREANNVFGFLFDANPSNTPAQLALRFCLSFPAVSTAIPGMLTDVHARENAAASDCGPLLSEQLQRSIQLGTTTEFFINRAIPTARDAHSL
ncbi:MAG TPA: aldo/keto reductase [Candidatus Saccharimonadales bacterium]|nr:aldo/keto reductase [Candidatus Saccharimonadales bacterium]